MQLAQAAYLINVAPRVMRHAGPQVRALQWHTAAGHQAAD
jgi:hypothetical protein